MRVTLRDGRSALERVELLAPPAGARGAPGGGRGAGGGGGGGANGGGGMSGGGGGMDGGGHGSGGDPQPGERLIDHRCHRYFYSPPHATFLPVPDVPRGFNARLRRAADALARRAPASGGMTAARRALSLVDAPAAAGAPAAAPADGGPFWGGPTGLALAWRRLRYGANAMVVPVRPLASLVFDEMWHPFYVFQYFSVVVWVAGDSYWSYAACILAITWFSIVTGSMEAHSNSARLAGIARHRGRALALRRADGGGSALGVVGGGAGFAGVFASPSSSAASPSLGSSAAALASGAVPLRWVDVSSEDLVPGDVVAVGRGVLPCDCVLLRGEAIVDENMLTGESVPVRKVAYGPLSDGLGYSPDRNPACTLYGGTCVAQAKFGGGSGGTGGGGGGGNSSGCNSAATAGAEGLPDPGDDLALAVVVRTRFYSAKGALLRSILHPKEHGEAFVGDSLRFIGVMLAACLLLFVWAAIALALIGAPASRIATRFLDMVTIAVPPALPACLTIATVFSVARLKEKDVFVTSPGATTAAGQLDVVCFDKTGTLTQQGLELQAIVPVVVLGGAAVGAAGGLFAAGHHHHPQQQQQEQQEGAGGGAAAAAAAASAGGAGAGHARFGPASAEPGLLPAALPPLLATCHGLARLADGTIVGDPLDQKLFAASGWGLYDGSHHGSRPHAAELEAARAAAAMAAAAAASAAAAAASAASAGGKPPPPAHVLLDEADLLEAAAAWRGDPASPTVLGGGSGGYGRGLVAVDAVASASAFGGGAAAAAAPAAADAAPAAADNDNDGAAGGPAASTAPTLLDPASVQSWAAPPGTAPTVDASHAVVRRFEFSAELQRNAVVVRVPRPPAAAEANGGGGFGAPAAAAAAAAAGPTLILYAKGSPEAIRALVDPLSVPADFDAVLGGFTREGLRVLALAAGDLTGGGRPGGGGGKDDSGGKDVAGGKSDGKSGGGGGKTAALPSTEDAEDLLAFVASASQAELEARARPRLVGLAVMANPLRPDSAAVVAQLRAASVRCAMVTGDHVRTAVSVSHQCGILPAERSVLLVDGAPPAAPAAGAAGGGGKAPPVGGGGGGGRGPSPPPPPAAPATSGTAADSFADLSRAAAPPHQAPGAPTGAAAAAPPPPPHRLSVLHPDGSLEEGSLVDRAACVARALSGEVEVAVTGAGFSRLLDCPDPPLLEAVLRRACVFARMSPDNKRDLMLLLGDGLREPGPEGEEEGGGLGDDGTGAAGGGGGGGSVPSQHRSLGLHVGFCGDGANDCGALKAAHVGVSLCEAEASVAGELSSLFIAFRRLFILSRRSGGARIDDAKTNHPT